MNQEKIGKFIAKCRKEKKLTQAELAEKLGVTEKSISNWENGRNMPDISLFKFLCNELDISINELMSGEKIEEDEYRDRLEENIISTIDYNNKKTSEKNNRFGLILIIFGVSISIIAMLILPSESSWSGIYSILGAIISTIGIMIFADCIKPVMRCLCSFVFFFMFLCLLFVTDYISVTNIHQAPRFAISKEFYDDIIIYKTLFYDVYRVNYNTKREYYIIDTEKEYNIYSIPNTPFNRSKAGIDNIAKYKSNNLEDESNITCLIGDLPLSEYGYEIKIDKKEKELVINYNFTDIWLENEEYYFQKSLIYNSVSIFALIDNVEDITFIFDCTNYKISRRQIEEGFPNFKYIIKNGISKLNFNMHLESRINDNEFILSLFKQFFVDENLVRTKKIEVRNVNIIKTITDENEISEMIDIISRCRRYPEGTLFNAIGSNLSIDMYDENGEVIYSFLVFSTGLKGIELYKIDSNDINRLETLINVDFAM